VDTALSNRREALLQQIDQLGSIPSVEAIVLPLIGYLQQPLESLDMQRVVDLISHDNSLAAQCLHMANSPLFGRWQTITSTRGAVIALGLQRMRDIAMSCCMLKMIPGGMEKSNPVVLWEHSLACAFVCRRIAKRIGMSDPEQAYLAGLLHDLGFVVNLHVLPQEFPEIMQAAAAALCALDKLEEERLGLTHCESGRLLGHKWNLDPSVIEVISHHHCLSPIPDHLSLIALVNLGDRLCRANGLGYGYVEPIVIDWNQDESVMIIRDAWPTAKLISWPKFSSELESYLKDVKKLVSVLYRFQAA
jgi:HD-like signal output (HDOD) protein